MYFLNFLYKIFLNKSLKKKFAIEYKIKDPNTIEIKDTIVPIHFPNKIPDTIVSGEPKPSNEIQIMQKIEK